MNRSLALGAFGHATSLFLAVSFALCVAGDLLMPAHEMHSAWERLLPGFTWISWGQLLSRSRRKLRVWLVHRAHLGAALQRNREPPSPGELGGQNSTAVTNGSNG